ncbi:DUF1501 domain-containing protein [Vibrio coralliilyticus]|uniref:DUF1501 domain-containing protein n=1 Tax=Vibrio coralliilyticus TaxID=190893 RepID=UPI00148D4EDD|nr:DUF1501 domain-containing protein [Vibrio coralliilyticus]NOH55380.1 DUF1501 domain-containing protein [Vibrio coralliilyticus]
MGISRRQFIKSSTAASACAGLMLAGTAPVYAAPKPVKNTLGNIKPAKKALVFIMLDGGNDSYNMLVPTSERHYRDYQTSRSNLALNKNELLALSGYKDAQGRRFGLHPSMPEVQRLFDTNKLAFVANTGPMIKPIEKSQFYSGNVPLPLGLMSHSDQFKHWQTARPGERINRGWFGYFADALQSNKPIEAIPMNISLAGSNIMQNGLQSAPYSITESGSVGLIINESPTELNKLLLNNFESSLNQSYPNDPFKQSYLAITRESQAQHEIYRKAVEGIRVKTTFSDSPLSKELRKVAQSIKAADNLGHQQQTFFLRYIGWDHHDELLNNHASMLAILSKALGEFQRSLDELGIAEQVVTFTGSDFGRTLTSNGNGTDHGWGGNTIVMGDAVNGGKIYGDYPSLTLGSKNPLDVGDGVLIPTTAIDELYAELARWFGASEEQLHRLLPNLKNFRIKGEKDKLSGLLK